jgi:hypothetical protein
LVVGQIAEARTAALKGASTKTVAIQGFHTGSEVRGGKLSTS